MDADSLIHLEHPGDAVSRVSALSVLRDGPEVAVPRILESYARLDICQTFFVPACCIEPYPQAVEAMAAGGHEVGHHGYIHENPASADRGRRGLLAAARHRGDRKAHRPAATLLTGRSTAFSTTPPTC